MREKLKLLKKLFYVIMGLILAGCAGVLVCAFNPSLTQMLSGKIENAGQATGNGSYTESQPGINTNWLNSRNQVSYEIPGSRPAKPPSAVSGKMGYEPIQEVAEQILPEEADNLSENISVGETGSGLSFDQEFYPYYAMLDSDMQQLYNQIYANAQNLTASFSPVVPVSVGQLKNVFEAVYNDHPELFWLDSGYSCKYLRSGSCVEITLKYNSTVSDLNSAKQNFLMGALQFLSGASSLGSTAEKEQYIHDALMMKVDYDLKAPMNQSAYSALVQGRSVCAGYARAYQYLMQQLGIPCYYCTGYAGEDHAWNIVKLNGGYVNVDVTWDDTDPATYDYFNKTDQEFASTHMRTGLSIYLPACVAEGQSSTNTTTSSGVADFINPNPIKPLVWQGNPQTSNTDTGLTAEEKKKANLEEAGITEDQVRDTMDAYYKECLTQLKKVGKGDKQYSIVIPESLWNSVERAYVSGEYWKKYVEDALKELEAENYTIRIQVERLGGGYYRVYHNVYTY